VPDQTVSYRGIATAALHARADQDKARAQQLAQDLTQLMDDLAATQRRLMKSVPWLAVHCAVSLGGLIAAPVTLGWSLLITAGDIALLCRNLASSAMSRTSPKCSNLNCVNFGSNSLKSLKIWQ
jgi:hypothetical protein